MFQIPSAARRRLLRVLPALPLALAVPVPARAAGEADTLPLNARLLESAKRNDAEGARRALAAGAVADSRNRKGRSALYLFVEHGNLDMARDLVARGADPNLAAVDRTTPLMAAAHRGDAALVELLLAAGALPDGADQVDKTALVYAAAGGHLQALARLLDGGAVVDRADRHQLTALMWAAGYGQTACVRLLLDRGARRELRDDRGKRAEDIARERGFEETVRALRPEG